jgi:hypothetical protein
MPPLIIDHSNADEQVKLHCKRIAPNANIKTLGCLPRRSAYGHYAGAIRATDLIEPIPRSLWPQLIAAGAGNWLHDLTRHHLPPHDQGDTKYCWAHGSVRALETLRVFEGQEPEILSAESVAVPVTGGQNRGGYPEEALDRLICHGACQQNLWPKNDRDISHALPGWEDDGLNHRVIRWLDVDGFAMQMTCAILRIPVAIGLRWWHHLVCQLDPIHLPDGRFGLGCDNSWGADYGDNGYFILAEEKATADLGAFAPISATFEP